MKKIFMIPAVVFTDDSFQVENLHRALEEINHGLGFTPWNGFSYEPEEAETKKEGYVPNYIFLRGTGIVNISVVNVEEVIKSAFEKYNLSGVFAPERSWFFAAGPDREKNDQILKLAMIQYHLSKITSGYFQDLSQIVDYIANNKERLVNLYGPENVTLYIPF